MKKDFDYVTMGDYTKDTAELVELSNNITERLRKDLRDAQILISYLIKAAGKIEIYRGVIYSEPCAYEVAENPATDTLIYRTIN